MLYQQNEYDVICQRYRKKIKNKKILTLTLLVGEGKQITLHL